MNKGFAVIKNRLTGESIQFSLDEFTCDIKRSRPEYYCVWDLNWENPVNFKVPSDFDYNIKKVTSQLSKLKKIGDRMIATMFNLDTATFRMYLSLYSSKNNVKFRTSLNVDGDLIIIRKK